MRTVGPTDRQTDRYDEVNSRFPQISLTHLKAVFSGGLGVSVCVCVCVCVCVLDVLAYFKLLAI